MVIETTVVFNKTGVPDAIALEVELQMGPDLSYVIYPNVSAYRISLLKLHRNIENQFYQATSLTGLQALYMGYDQHVWTLSKRFLLVSI